MTWMICISGIESENIMDINMYEKIKGVNDRLYVWKQVKKDNVYGKFWCAYVIWIYDKWGHIYEMKCEYTCHNKAWTCMYIQLCF